MSTQPRRTRREQTPFAVVSAATAVPSNYPTLPTNGHQVYAILVGGVTPLPSGSGANAGLLNVFRDNPGVDGPNSTLADIYLTDPRVAALVQQLESEGYPIISVMARTRSGEIQTSRNIDPGKPVGPDFQFQETPNPQSRPAYTSLEVVVDPSKAKPPVYSIRLGKYCCSNGAPQKPFAYELHSNEPLTPHQLEAMIEAIQKTAFLGHRGTVKHYPLKEDSQLASPTTRVLRRVGR